MARTEMVMLKKATELRGNYNRALRQEDLRERIAASNVLTMIDKCEARLLDLANPLEAIEVARIAKALDSCHKRLAKILPDLKSVEISRISDDSVTIDQIPEDKRDALRQQLLDSLGASRQSIMADPVTRLPEDTGGGGNTGMGGDEYYYPQTSPQDSNEA
jgi:hypothetical protein